ncbi:hypothetical protein R3I93_001225 [Phoxinus phoxinus]|uniref:Uncharacterized protein n=2 Tax=Phoxinus phoxinus TaxID=58324 RepID=A0AAN9DRF2_9TELE
MSSISVRVNLSSDALHSLQRLQQQTDMGSSSSTGEVDRADEIYQQKLVNELQQSIKGFNLGFNINHQTLTGHIKRLNDITGEHEETTVGRWGEAKKRIAAIVVLGLSLTETMIENLRTISNTIKELQQMEKDYDQNKVIMRRVRSMNMERIDKLLELHYKELNGKKDELLNIIDDYKVTGQNKSLKHIPEIRGTAAKFQETLNGIKHAKDYINKLD